MKKIVLLIMALSAHQNTQPMFKTWYNNAKSWAKNTFAVNNNLEANSFENQVEPDYTAPIDIPEYSIENDFYLESPDQRKLQAWCNALINKRIQKDMLALKSADKETVKTFPLYLQQAAQHKKKIQAQDLVDIYAMGKNQKDENLIACYAQDKGDALTLPFLLFNTDCSGATQPNNLGKSTIALYNLHEKNSKYIYQDLQKERLEHVLQHEWTHVEQDADIKILNSLGTQCNMPELGHNLANGVSAYLDNLAYNEQGTVCIETNPKKQKRDFFAKHCPPQGRNIFTKVSANLLDEAEADLKAIDYAQNLQATQKMLGRLVKLCGDYRFSPYYLSHKTLFDYATKKLAEQQAKN